MTLFAQVVAGYSLLQILIFVIIIAAAVAITLAILSAMGVAVPPVAVRVFWILVLAFLGIAALVFLFSLVGRMGPGQLGENRVERAINSLLTGKHILA
jgi:choline-glycine betaine transporter